MDRVTKPNAGVIYQAFNACRCAPFYSKLADLGHRQYQRIREVTKRPFTSGGFQRKETPVQTNTLCRVMPFFEFGIAITIENGVPLNRPVCKMYTGVGEQRSKSVHAKG